MEIWNFLERLCYVIKSYSVIGNIGALESRLKNGQFNLMFHHVVTSEDKSWYFGSQAKDNVYVVLVSCGTFECHQKVKSRLRRL